MKKVLVTGSSGYIGSHLCHILKDEYEVHGLDIAPPMFKMEHFHHIDITQGLDLDIEFDAVVHLAALVKVGDSVREPISYYLTNINGTLNVLERIKAKNFILASTGAAVGCTSPYGVSKRAAEDIVHSYRSMSEMDYTIFRFYNVIGSTVVKPTNPDGLMYNLMNAPQSGIFTIFGNDYDVSPDGTCIRDYVHVEEICHSIKLAIEKPANKIECLGHGVGYTVNEMVNIFQRVNNVDFDIKYGPRRKGDLPSSVLEDVSPYMSSLYTIEQLLKV